MELSTHLMAEILGGIGMALYLSAPFFEDSKKAFRTRLLSEFFWGLMFLYLNRFSGIAYYFFLMASGLFQKQVEQKKWFALGFGFIAAIATALVNTDGPAGYLLAASLVLIFCPVDEQRMLATAAAIDVITMFALFNYSVHVRAWVSTAFSVLLLIMGLVGLYSAVRLAKAGGLMAAALEEQRYRQSKTEKKNTKKRNFR